VKGSSFLVRAFWVGVATCFGALVATAGEQVSSVDRGTEIARAAEQSHSGFGSISAEGLMTLRDPNGHENERRFDSHVLDDPEGYNRSLIEFVTPAEVKGVKLLTHGVADGQDNQWIFLKSLGRVKRISGASSSNSFLGSEFSYEDLSSPKVEKFSFRWINDEACPNSSDVPSLLVCDVIERTPLDEYSGYSKSVVWIDRTLLLTHQIDFYDKQGRHIKTLDVHRHEKVDEVLWRVRDATMTNLLTQRSTQMNWSGFDLSQNYSLRDFDPRRLGR